MDVIHSAIQVSDLETSVQFYEEAMNLHVTREFESGDGAKNIFLAGEGEYELQLKYHPEKAVPEPAGFDHTAIEVEDIDAELERLQNEFDCEVYRGPIDSEVAHARVAFIKDPDGYGIELVEEWE